MKKFKIIAFIFAIMTTMPILQSCLDDDDNSSDLLAISTINMISQDSKEFYFTLDDGKKMLPGDTTSIHNYLVKDGQRAFVYFNLLEEKKEGYDYNAKVQYIENILTKSVIPMDEQTTDSIGDDRINIVDMWLGGGYLNIEFQLFGTQNIQKKHMLNLVRNERQDAPQEDADYINLEFRHNAYDDTPAYLGNGFVCFKLDNIDTTKKGFNIRVNTLYNGIKQYKINMDTSTASLNASLKAYTEQTIPIK
jgi:hypothetical protein